MGSSRSDRVRDRVAGLLPGARARLRQVVDHRRAWHEANRAALGAEGPCWVVLGDSVSQAVGASSIERGWVSLVAERLRADRDPTWRVVNLSVSGARTADVADGQLPSVEELPRVDLVTCAVGANDLLRSRWPAHRAALARLLSALPPGAVVATLPQGLRERRALEANRLIAQASRRRDLVVADVWAHTGPPWAGRYATDHFHPSDRGHADWAAAFTEALGLDPE